MSIVTSESPTPRRASSAKTGNWRTNSKGARIPRSLPTGTKVAGTDSVLKNLERFFLVYDRPPRYARVLPPSFPLPSMVFAPGRRGEGLRKRCGAQGFSSSLLISLLSPLATADSITIIQGVPGARNCIFTPTFPSGRGGGWCRGAGLMLWSPKGGRNIV